MSEISLSLAPSPEPLTAAIAGGTGPARPAGPDTLARPGAGEAATAANPFATLLSGILSGTIQAAAPVAETGATAAFDADLADLLQPADVSASPAAPVALPGTATPMTPLLEDGAQPADGNPLPVAGKGLPPEPAPTTPPRPATPADAPTPASPARVSLADLALSRPLEAPPEPAADGDGAVTAAVFRLAGRSALAAKGTTSDTSVRTPLPGHQPVLAPGSDPALLIATGVANTGAGKTPLALTANDLARVTGLPGTGGEFLASQVAAFAAGGDGNTKLAAPSADQPATNAPGPTLASRLGTTTLPPLQPLADAGSFAGGLSDRLLTLAGPGTHSARLTLHPEQLGELNVEITMEDGTAQVWFGTSTAQARDAVEGSLPRLKELFAEQGIQLTRAQVDAGGGQMGNSAFGQERRMTGGAGAWSDVPAWQPGNPGRGAEPPGAIAPRAPARLLDVWA